MAGIISTVACRRPCSCKAASQGLESSPRFKKWAAREGVLFPKLDIFSFDGLRGMRAEENVSNGEIVVRLPRNCALVIEPTTKSVDGCPDDVWKRQSWFLKLAMKLAHEIKLGEHSRYYGYVQSLPDSVDIPCFWNDEDIERLQYPSLIAAIKKQQTEWDAMVDDVINNAPDLQMDATLLKRCLSYVASRSFSGPYVGSKLSDRIRLGAVVLVLAAINIGFAGVNALEPTVNAVLAVSTFNFLYDIFLSQRLKEYVLAPGVDFMNHSSRVSCDLSYDYFFDGYSVTLDADYEAAEQVFISYGQKSNDDLLQYYGFLETDNQYDKVIVEDGMKKLHKIFCQTTGVDGDASGIVDGSVTVRSQGLDRKTLKAIETWTKDANEGPTCIPRMLITFCQDEVNVLMTADPKEERSRDQLIFDFRKEKASILTKCIELLEEQKDR